MATAPEFTIDAYVDALTRLPDYGGYEAFASGLSQDFPGATFQVGPVGGGREGIRYEGLPIAGGAKQAGPLGQYSNEVLKRLYSNNPTSAIVQAQPVVWPTLSRLTSSPAPNVGIELAPEQYDILPTGGNLYEGKPSDDDWGKEHKGAVGDHLAWQQAGLGQDSSGQLPSAIPITQNKQRELANELEERQKALSAPALAASKPSFDLGAERYDIPQQIQTIRSAPVATDAGMVATQRVRPQVDPAGNIDLVEPPQPVTGQQVTARTTQNFQPEPVVGKVTDPIVASLPAISLAAPAFDQARTQPVDTLPSVYDTGAISVDIPTDSGQVDNPLSLFDPIDDTGSAGISNVPRNVIDEAPLLDYVGDPVEEVPFVIEGDYTPSPPSMADPELPAPIPVEEPMVQAPPVLADPEVAKVLNTVNQAPDWVLDLSAQRDYDQQLDTTQNTAPNTRYIADQQALAKEELPDPQPGWEEAKKAELEALDEELQAGLEEFLQEQAIVDSGLTQVNVGDDSGITNTAMPVDDTVVTDDLVLDKPIAEELPLPTTASVGIEGGTGLPKEPETNLKATVTNTPLTEVVPEGTSATAEPIDLTGERERLAGQGKGWADSGEWGYARTRNLLTGGGQAPVVTQGPLVPWQSMGEDASSTRYLSNVGDRDYFPSRLAPGERLGETTPASEIDYVPESQRTGWNEPINIGPGIREGGEGRVPFQNHLEGLSESDIASIPDGLDLRIASTNAIQNRDNLKANIKESDFDGVDSFDKLDNMLSSKLGGIGESVSEFVQSITGMTESDLKGPGLWNTLNTPIPAFSTGEFGITPLDVILVAAGGLPALGSIVTSKLMKSIFQPVTSAISGGMSRVFEGVFNRGGGEVSAEDINRADIDVLAEELGVDKHFGMVDKGVYYNAAGDIHATNMQPTGFNANDVGSADAFKGALRGMVESQGNMENFSHILYNTNTGDVTSVSLDGSETVIGTMPIGSDGKVMKGDVKSAKGSPSKSRTREATGISVVYVDPIDMVRGPRRRKPKKDEVAPAPSGGGKQNVKTLWDWLARLLPGGSESE